MHDISFARRPVNPGALPVPEDPADASVFIPQGVCSRCIHFVVRDHKLEYVRFTGGCDGNLKAVSALVTGMDVADIIRKLGNITCGTKGTSCAAQLCRALREQAAAEE